MTARLIVDTDHAAYALRRPAERQRVIPLRRARRLALGDMVTVEFENAETLSYQAQEMVYTERLTDPADVAGEIAVYSRLLPGPHHLCATLFLELDDPATVRAELARVAGIQHALRLEVGGQRSPGVEIVGLDENEDQPSDTVSVHMLRFDLNDAARDAFRDPELPALLVVDHPRYRDEAPIAGLTRRSLLADLTLAAAAHG